MEFKDCKIGQVVKANEYSNDEYTYTSKECNYEGKIIGIDKQVKMIAVEHPSGTYYSQTMGKYGYWVEPKYFDLLSSFGTMKKIDRFKCYRDGNKIIVAYKDKVLGVAKCNPNDEFDEEFGLALALGRALRNKDFKTKKETVITENIFDYIEI